MERKQLCKMWGKAISSRTTVKAVVRKAAGRQVSHVAKECYLVDLIILIVAETEETRL